MFTIVHGFPIIFPWTNQLDMACVHWKDIRPNFINISSNLKIDKVYWVATLSPFALFTNQRLQGVECSRIINCNLPTTPMDTIFAQLPPSIIKYLNFYFTSCVENIFPPIFVKLLQLCTQHALKDQTHTILRNFLVFFLALIYFGLFYHKGIATFFIFFQCHGLRVGTFPGKMSESLALVTSLASFINTFVASILFCTRDQNMTCQPSP